VAGNPRRSALFGVDAGKGGSRRLGGGGSRAQTGDPPPSHRTGLSAEPGTEICDAETGTQKPTYHLAETNPETRRSAKSPHSGAINAKRLAEVWALPLGGGGSRAQTGDPPPSHRTGLRHRAGNGNLRCRDGHAKADLSPSRDQSRDAQECKKPPFRGNKCEKACGSLSPTTGWWRRKGPNCQPPTQSSNRSLTSESGTEIFDAETGA